MVDVEKLLAVIEAKEQKAYQAQAGPWEADDLVGEVRELGNGGTVAYVPRYEDGVFIADNDPTSVLRRCEADKRQLARLSEMVELGEDYYDNPTVWDLVTDSLNDLAFAYSVSVDSKED